MSELTDRLRERATSDGIEFSYYHESDGKMMTEAADALDRMEARIAELEGALKAFVEFDDMPLPAKRPDVFSLILNRARRALSEGEG